MSGYIRQIQSSDGTPITAPSTIILSAASYVVFANDAAYEAVYGAGSEGDSYFNSTDQQVRVYKNAAWEYHKADESVYDNATSGLTATDVQAAIDEVEGRVDAVESGKQDDVITTRGDTIIGNASGDASRLAIGSAGFVLTSDGTDPSWAPAAGGGGVGGKNYILNPDAAVNATTGVTNTATTGSWTIARTTTAAELPEETKGTAYKISGSTLTVGDTVEFAIEATGIDDADGGFIARGVIKVLDISGAINGEYKGQFYSVTDSVYVGDEVTITGTGTYIMSVPVVAGDDYEFHLKAATASPTNIGLSGITLEPESPTYGSLGGWKEYTEANGDFTVTGTNWTTASTSAIPYKDPVSGNWRMAFNFRGTVAPTAASLTITVSGVTNSFQQAIVTTNGSEGYGLATASAGTYSATCSGSGGVFLFSGDVALTSKPTWADWDNTAPTISDVQYENARVRYYMTSNTAFTAGNPIPYDTEDTTTHQTFGNWTNSSGRITVPVAGTYKITARNQWTVARVAGDQDLIYVNRNGGGDAIERRLSSTSEVLALGTEVYLTPDDTFFVSSNVSKTINSDNTLSYLEIAKISDFSARSVSLPFPNGTLRLDTGNGHGGSSSGETEIRNFTNATVTGDAFTYTTRTATTADFITVNRDMVASFTFDDACTTGAFAIGISLNSSQLSTDIDAITKDDRLVAVEQSTSLLATASVTIKLNKGDKIRAHTDGTPNISLGITQFVAQEIYRLGN